MTKSQVLDFEQEAAEVTEKFFSVLSGFLLFKEVLSKVMRFSHHREPPVLGRTNPLSSETRIIGLADGGPINRAERV
jgi:hypothetical protein